MYLRILIIIFLLTDFCFSKSLNGEISYEKVLNDFIGSWEVTSVQTYTSNKNYKTSSSLDYWTLEKNKDIVTLKNPISNAIAQITIDEVIDNTLKFRKISNDGYEKIIESPVITLNGNTFTGYDTILIECFDENGKLINKTRIEFKLYGKKVNN